MPRSSARASAVLLILGALAAALLAGCGGSSSSATGSSGKLGVVAAEDFWGSIAEQLGGDKVEGDEHHHQPGRRPARLRTDE